MARLVALPELRSRIRLRANVRSVRFTNTVLNDMINEARLITLDEILAANPTYNLTSGTCDITSGQDYVNLPAGCFKVYGVRVLDSDGLWKPIEPFEWEDQFDASSDLTDRPSLRYHFDGYNATAARDRLRFQTAPGWTQVAGLKAYFNPVPAALTDATPGTTDVWDGVFGWDEHTVCQVTLWIRESKDRDTSSIMAQLQMAANRISRRAKNRDIARVPRMRDARAARHRASKLPWPG